MTNNSVGILGIGSSLPNKVISNFDLEKMVDTSDEWIVKRTGISERRVLEKDEPAFKLGADAALKAIKDANLTPSDIDLIIVATETPDYLTPSTSANIQREIGAENAAVFDLNAACSGFMYAMTVAQQFIATGYYRYVLVIGCEGLSKAVDWEDRNTCVLFGDGAGAAVLGKVEDNYGILGSFLGADGKLGPNITLPCCYISECDLEKRVHENKKVLWMDGGEVFKFAVKIMEYATLKVLEKTNIPLSDIDLIFPHQANIRIIEGAAKRLNLTEDKVYANVERYGNISSASIPVALDEASKKGRIKKGDLLVLVGFGGGLTWGSIVLKWSKE